MRGETYSKPKRNLTTFTYTNILAVSNILKHSGRAKDNPVYAVVFAKEYYKWNVNSATTNIPALQGTSERISSATTASSFNVSIMLLLSTL